MPIIYHHRHRSTSMSSTSSNENEPVHPINADDSIVLSDLVRTGEASRLRRRGAMRLDHNPPSNVVVLDDSDDEDSPNVFRYPSRERRRRYSSRSLQQERERRAGAGPVPGISASLDSTTDDDTNEYWYTLVCGGYESDAEGEEAQAHDNSDDNLWTPSILPLYPPTASSSATPQRRRTRTTNGCGALIHLGAAPRQRLSMWTAKSNATSAVVAMDPMYFDSSAVAKIVRSSCGCVREGVGCAMCGNPLGTRYIPCKTATDGLFSAGPKPSPPLRPEGPRYWHGCPSSSSSSQYVYSFFSTAVSPYPEYTFPAKPSNISPRVRTYSASSPPPLPRPQFEFEEGPESPTPPVYNNSTTMFDRYISASPTPLSDVGEGEEDSRSYVNNVPVQSFYQQQMQIRIETQEWESRQDPDQGWGWGMSRRERRFDPDGEDYIHDMEGDPGSPDKVGESMGFAER